MKLFSVNCQNNNIYISNLIMNKLFITLIVISSCTYQITATICNDNDKSSILHKEECHHSIKTKQKDVTKLFNFASTECGAEVIKSNFEAENIEGILDDTDEDEYYRSPCYPYKYIIIQLCDISYPLIIELANYELFSSSIKEFRILGSIKNPTKNWTILGDFIAENNRDIQRFRISPQNIQAKFIKIEWLSHYNNEYYCTLSIVKVFGIEVEGNQTKRIKVMKPKKELSFGPVEDF